MDKKLFWNLIEETKSSCGESMEAMTGILRDKLIKYPIKDIKKFDSIFYEYHGAAYKAGIRDVGRIMNRGIMTDDGFIDFRSWLIAQGREVYMEALKNPEILAEKARQPIDGWYEFETIAYAATYAIEKKSKKRYLNRDRLSNDEKTDILSEIVYNQYADKAMTLNELRRCFPKLTKRFLKNNCSC